jgi:hypothetical protein
MTGVNTDTVYMNYVVYYLNAVQRSIVSSIFALHKLAVKQQSFVHVQANTQTISLSQYLSRFWVKTDKCIFIRNTPYGFIILRQFEGQ